MSPEASKAKPARTVYFNGGTLRASGDNDAFMQGLGHTFVGTGGAVIDSQSFTISIAQKLEHDAANLGATPDGGLMKTGSGTLILSGD